MHLWEFLRLRMQYVATRNPGFTHEVGSEYLSLFTGFSMELPGSLNRW